MQAIKKPLILIVDDTPKNIQVLGNILHNKGYNLCVATSGLQAIESAKTELPDLILLDIQMPEMDGFEVCKVLKSNPKTKAIPVIFLTAVTEPERILYGFELGAVDYVTKPFNVAELTARVATHIEIKQSREKLQKLYDQMNSYLNLAIKTQASLIATEFPTSPFFQFSSFYKPYFKIGGDLIAYKDYPSDTDRRIDILFGDISGHGVSSALMSGMILLAFKIASSQDTSPAESLLTINQLIIPLIKGHFFCGAYLKYYVQRNELQYSYAGHHPIVSIENSLAENLEGRGMPLVLIPEATFTDYSFQLKTGNKLLLYSDGMFEVFDSNNEMYGIENFNEAAAKVKNKSGTECLTELYEKIEKFCDGNFRDDMTMLLLEIL
jgi:phosphoserine phosphatase RsbU/P